MRKNAFINVPSIWASKIERFKKYHVTNTYTRVPDMYTKRGTLKSKVKVLLVTELADVSSHEVTVLIKMKKK